MNDMEFDLFGTSGQSAYDFSNDFMGFENMSQQAPQQSVNQMPPHVQQPPQQMTQPEQRTPQNEYELYDQYVQQSFFPDSQPQFQQPNQQAAHAAPSTPLYVPQNATPCVTQNISQNVSQNNSYNNSSSYAGNTSSTYDNQMSPNDLPTHKCPCCGKDLRRNNWGFSCTGWKKDGRGCNFTLSLNICGHKLNENEISHLVTKGKLNQVNMHSNRTGNDFTADLVLADDKEKGKKVTFRFANADDSQPGTLTDIECPKCGRQLAAKQYSYMCECGYKLRKVVAHRDLSVEEAKILIVNRRVGPLDGFTSKTGNIFSTTLVLNSDNTITFDFQKQN